jgi:pimeloyl-ACP methyl ester carboxylesterase
MMAAKTEHRVRVDGLDVRYLDEGTGPALILLHGAALGSSCDVWVTHLTPLAARGLRVIAYDRPGYGGTGDPDNGSAAYQERFVLLFMDALGLDRAGLVAHSQTGSFGVGLGLSHPDRISRLMVLGTGSMLPPLEAGMVGGPAPGESGPETGPTREAVRAILEAQLYNHALITADLIERRYQVSLGHRRAQPPQPAAPATVKPTPLWQRLDELTIPLLMMYGKDDRGSVPERAALLLQRYPAIDLRLVDHCKHLVQLDAENEFLEAAGEFFAP